MDHENTGLDFAGHINQRHHIGVPEFWTHQGSIASPRCGDKVALHLLVWDGHIREAWHTVQGCLVCQAASSFICEWAERQSIDEVTSTTEADFLSQLPRLTPMRQQCALLPFRCLKQLLESLDENAPAAATIP